MDVEQSWVRVMLLAGGLAGLGGAAGILGPLQQLTFNSYGTYGFDGITVALLGRASPLGVVLAALLFGALHAGGTNMRPRRRCRRTSWRSSRALSCCSWRPPRSSGR